jgi:hypothetical protein
MSLYKEYINNDTLCFYTHFCYLGVKDNVQLCGMTSGVDINIHIKHALITNNLFVDTAEKVKEILNLDKFYNKKNGNKYLAHGV